MKAKAALSVLLAVAVLSCDEGSGAAAGGAPEAKAGGDAKVAGDANAEPPARAESETAVAGPDPCSLITQARAEQALGHPVQEGVRSGKACRWKATAGPGSVTIEITQPRGAEVYAHELQLLGSDETVADLGTAAFRSGMIVGVHAGDRYIAIGLAPNIGVSRAPAPTAAVDLAREVIAALPEG